MHDRKRVRAAAGIAALLVVAATASSGSAALATTVAPANVASTGTLTLDAEFSISSASLVACPPDASGVTLECTERTGSALVPGLGSVTESYVYVDDVTSPACPATGSVQRLVLPMTAHLVVAGKGSIDLSVNGLQTCLSFGGAVQALPARTFSINGGTGAYANASGNGTVRQSLSPAPVAVGRDSWAGTLVVPGLDFDLAPPVLSGAVGKTVRVRRGTKGVRVSYKVTALDERDGAVPVRCTPRSGSRFRIGRTTVACSAADTSGNTAAARFRITVRTG